MPSLNYSDHDKFSAYLHVRNEVGYEVFSGLKDQPSGKLVLLQEWLYGRATDQSVSPDLPLPLASMVFRLAPSIITRSELELLGISTPRFAYRAYLTSKSFTNLRRLRVIETQIKSTHANGKLKNLLVGGMKNSYSWMADSLFEKPHRLRDYTVLTCDLAADYSEQSSAELTPFVTNVHVLVGGGQCAQAAVFMALCMSRAKKIYGIAEITKLCAGTPKGFPIEGLRYLDIVKFFEQKCTGVNGLSSVTVGLDKELELRLAENALYSYCLNHIPVIALTSIARMWGTHVPIKERWHLDFKPILRYSKQVDRSDYNALPLGDKPARLENDIPVTVSTKASDHHAVVLVGASQALADSSSSFSSGRRVFVFNDPATFPFIECSLDQLYAARAYIQERKQTSKSEDRQVTEQDLAPLTTLAVVPAHVRASLLNSQVSDEEDMLGNPTVTPGLLTMIHCALTGTGLLGLKYSPIDSPACNYPVFLLEVSARNGDAQWHMHCDLCVLHPDFQVVDLQAQKVPLKSKMNSGFYWVHHVQESDDQAQWSESIWIWPADSKFVNSSALVGCIVRDKNGASYRLLREFTPIDKVK